MTKEFKADISLIFITIFWGSSFPIISLALKEMSPITYLTYRYGISSIIMLFLTRKRLKNIDKNIVIAAFFIGGSLFLGSMTQNTGLLYTSPSKSGFITGLYVVLVPLIIGVWYKRVPDVKVIFGVIFSSIGLYFISVNDAIVFNLGDTLTLLAAFLFALQILFVDKFARGKDILLLTALEILIVAILGLIVAIPLGKLSFNITPFSIFAILYTSLFCTILAYGIQNKMQPYLNPTHAAIIFLFEPIFSAIFSIFIGDILSKRALIGAGFILFGMIITTIKKRRVE